MILPLYISGDNIIIDEGNLPQDTAPAPAPVLIEPRAIDSDLQDDFLRLSDFEDKSGRFGYTPESDDASNSESIEIRVESSDAPSEESSSSCNSEEDNPDNE